MPDHVHEFDHSKRTALSVGVSPDLQAIYSDAELASEVCLRPVRMLATDPSQKWHLWSSSILGPICRRGSARSNEPRLFRIQLKRHTRRKRTSGSYPDNLTQAKANLSMAALLPLIFTAARTPPVLPKSQREISADRMDLFKRAIILYIGQA